MKRTFLLIQASLLLLSADRSSAFSILVSDHDVSPSLTRRQRRSTIGACVSSTGLKRSRTIPVLYAASRSSVLYYKTEGAVDTEQEAPTQNTTKEQQKRKPILVRGLERKPIVTELSSFDSLKYLLEEEESNNRIVAVQFYSNTCKACQKLKPRYRAFSKTFGDGIVARQKVQGRVHCAQIALTPSTKHLVQDQLQVDRFPTIQLYWNQYKVMDISGCTDTKLVEERVKELWSLSPQELRDRAEALDDGVWQELVEDRFFFDQPDFLNEEW